MCKKPHSVPVGLSIFTSLMLCVILIIVIVLQFQLPMIQINNILYYNTVYTGYWWGILLFLAAFFVGISACTNSRCSLLFAMVVNAIILGVGVAAITMPLFEYTQISEIKRFLNVTTAPLESNPAAPYYYSIIGLNALSMLILFLHVFIAMGYDSCCSKVDSASDYYD
ncbi:hypothetical protein Ciccas_006535 [Cichlidogyrus casuarinus]|uniref:Uncharacterized protein n=1 Tax=Cichlidogyrus casuarinus TaxID=1844966 RepID=A0ABD2Q5G5_9PLAT